MGKNQNNPLLQRFDTVYDTAPFHLIRNEHFLPAFKFAIKEGEKDIQNIINDSNIPDFKNTIVMLEKTGRLLDRISGVFYNLLSAETNDELQKIAREVSPLLTEFHNNITLNPDLFKRVKNIYEQKNQCNLLPEEKTLLENTYIGFVRQGANLDDIQKKRFREISTELSKLSLSFNENILKETNRYELYISEKEQLSGLPESVLEAAAQKAIENNKKGWIFDITAPSFIPFLKYADNRTLRKTLYLAYHSKSFKNDEYDNQEIIKRIVELRLEIAKILGYKTYADYVLERRMAINTKNVYKLLDDLYNASFYFAKNELKELQEYAKTFGFKEKIMPWDTSYYSEKLREKKYHLNDEMLKPYFELNKVINGIFGLASELYGITFKQNFKIPVYHEEVKPYEVFDNNGDFLAVLYTDFHPRKGKQGGAWMNDFKAQWKENGKDSRPHIAIVMNFSRPTNSKPALLTFTEVETFLHEFGHALHGILSKTVFASLSGTSVYRDFVELPSQIMENWAVEKDFLNRFAFHYITGEKIPEKMIEKIRASKNFMSGSFCLRQLSFGYLDMKWHTLENTFQGNVKEFEEKAWAKTRLYPIIKETCMSTQFGHLFSGGYAAGYYGYKWAEVLDADAFELFKENGLFDKSTAKSFRKNILEKGGAEHPMILYKRFRGKEPEIKALLKRSGLK